MERDVMNDKDSSNIAKEPVIEDLTVNQDQEAEVKGGPIYMKYDGVDGDVTARGWERDL